MVQTQSRFFYGYWILLVGLVCQVVMNGVVTYAFSLYVIPLDAEFGWNRATTMVGYMVMQLISALASLLIGRFIYQWGVKWIIAIGALLLGIGFTLLSLTQTIWQFYLIYVIIGFGSSFTGVVPTSMVVCNWFNKRRGFAIGVLGMGIGIGGFTMPIFLGTYVIPNFGWRMSCLVSGIISAGVLIPLSLLLIKPRPEDMGLLPDNGEIVKNSHDRTSNAPALGFKLNEALKTKAFWFLVVAFTFFGFANGHTFQNQVPHLQDVGFSTVVAASALSIVGIGSAIGKFSYGWLCDFVSPKYILVIGSVLEAGATLILLSITPNSPVFMLWLYAIMFGLGIGSWFPAISMTTSDTFGLVAYVDIFGIYNMLFGIEGAISPFVGGYVFDTTGSYRLMFLLCLIFYFLAVSCMLIMRRPKTKEKVGKLG